MSGVRLRHKMHTYDKIFFVGIGGIGMSALARFFALEGCTVAGYDRTPSALTRNLETEGIAVAYDDVESAVPQSFREGRVLVVRTPAVPADSCILRWFEEHGFEVKKRAEVLGLVTRTKRALCVAGTHGKTTTSAMLTHLLNYAGAPADGGYGVNAFLGGISVNYGTNMLHSAESDLVVVEADEYDRSFHHLRPTLAVVTSTDPDHLDIYGTAEAYRESFSIFTSLIREGGVLLRKAGIVLESRLAEGVRELTYGVLTGDTPAQRPDFYAENVRTSDGALLFDFCGPNVHLKDVSLGVPVWVNVENAVAAMAAAWLNGVSAADLEKGIACFKGTLRRFNTLLKTDSLTLIDDYAHHPDELRMSISSVRRLYPQAVLTGVFQPHLYTRTRDFYKQFAASLSMLDRVILLPIYPAREKPIEGVTSELILNEISITDKRLVEKTELASVLKELLGGKADCDRRNVVLTLGAGDIDRLLPELQKRLANV